MTAPLSATRVGVAFGRVGVTVTSSPPHTQGNDVTYAMWDYATESGLWARVVAGRMPSSDGDPAALVRGAVQAGDARLEPAQWLTGIGDHAALYRSRGHTSVMAAARRGDDLVMVVFGVNEEDAPAHVVIELAEEAFVNTWGE